jgi:hypothetical protein
MRASDRLHRLSYFRMREGPRERFDWRTALVFYFIKCSNWASRMFEWLAGVSAGFAFKPILEDLAKEGAKEGGKAFFGSFCKGRLRQVLPGMDPWRAAVAKVIKEFLEQFEQELIGCTEPEMSAGGYIRSLKEFTMLAFR